MRNLPLGVSVWLVLSLLAACSPQLQSGATETQAATVPTYSWDATFQGSERLAGRYAGESGYVRTAGEDVVEVSLSNSVAAGTARFNDEAAYDGLRVLIRPAPVGSGYIAVASFGEPDSPRETYSGLSNQVNVSVQGERGVGSMDFELRDDAGVPLTSQITFNLPIRN